MAAKDNPTTGSRRHKAENHAEIQAQALRNNLRRRKQQQAERRQTDESSKPRRDGRPPAKKPG